MLACSGEDLRRRKTMEVVEVPLPTVKIPVASGVHEAFTTTYRSIYSCPTLSTCFRVSIVQQIEGIVAAWLSNYKSSKYYGL
jgi:hypothetical protein